MGSMVAYKVAKIVKILVMVVLFVVVFGFLTMYLWNWLMPSLFGLRTITYWQAVGLLVLGKLLFGGFHKHGGDGGRHGWKRHMEERWSRMSPEERVRFKAGMKGRCGFGFGEREFVGGRDEAEQGTK